MAGVAFGPGSTPPRCAGLRGTPAMRVSALRVTISLTHNGPPLQGGRDFVGGSDRARS